MKYKIIILVCLLFSYGAKAQTITNLTPNVEDAGTFSLPVTINGSGTNFSAGTSTIIQISQGASVLEVLSVNAFNPLSIDLDIRIPYTSNLGQYDVFVFDPNYGFLTLPNGFTVTAPSVYPQIIETYPDTVRANWTLPVTISTANAHFMQATDNIIYLTQGTHTIFPIPNTTTVLSNDSIRAVFDFNLPFLSVGDVLNSHCGNAFDGILTDNLSIEIVDSTLSVGPQPVVERLKAFPNPTDHTVNIELPSDLVDFQWSVYNQLGQKIWTQTVKNNTSQTIQADLSDLPKGNYLVKIQSKTLNYTVQVVKN